MRGIYLDWNATTPPHPSVLEAMNAAASKVWANPASVHGPGRAARALVDDAREAVAALVRMHPRDVVLTSGGTEANNLALRAAVGDDARAAGLVVGRVEHPSVTRAAEALEGQGATVEWVRPDAAGRIDADALRQAVDRAARRATIRLISVQVVNHETGVVHPIAAIAELARARGAWLHVDAVQAVGRLAPEAWEGADLITVAAHKIRGPKGIGALVTRPGLRLLPLLHGGSQERGLRPGTQDPAACAGFRAACERARDMPARYAELGPVRDGLERSLRELGARHGQEPIPNGDEPRAPHVTNLSWPGWRGAELCAALDLEGVAVSSGSACSAGTAEPSAVIREIAGAARAESAVRVSIGEETTPGDLAEALERWERVLTRGPLGVAPAR